MENLKILNTREIKKVHELLKSRFGFEKKLDVAFLENNKDKIYIVNKDFADIDISKLRINSMGMYFAEIKNNEIRLSIEGSQIVGKEASKNILELDEKNAKEWLKGFDIYKDIEDKGYILIKHKNDFLGCGKAVEEKILNFVPKTRRVRTTS